jgi:hypothetical protein
MKCPHCNAEVPEGDLFCGECGKQVAPEEPSTTTPPPKRAIAPWVIVVVVLVGLVVVGGGAATVLLRPAPTATLAPTATPTATLPPPSTTTPTPTVMPTATFTPAPTPTFTPVSQPKITAMVSALQIDQEGNPVIVTDIFPPGTTEVYFVFQYQDFGDIMEFQVIFYYNGVADTSGAIQLIDEDSGQYWFRYYNDDILQPGEYTLEAYVQDQSLGTYQFIILGETVALEDDFSDEASGWETGDTDIARVWYENGQLHVLVEAADEITGSLFGGQLQNTFGDFSMEVDVSVAVLPEAGAYYGILARAGEEGAYLFAVESGGYYAINTLIGEDWVALVDWAASDAILQGADVVNRLRIECLGPNLLFYANGTFLAEVEDATLASGAIGLIAASAEGGGAHIVFDNVVVYNVE